jgi:hypothetical protein
MIDRLSQPRTLPPLIVLAGCRRQGANIAQLGVTTVSETTWVCPYCVVAETVTDAAVVPTGTVAVAASVAVTVAPAWTSV